MAGYSGTPLAAKLGLKPGMIVLAAGAPAGYRKLLAPLPPNLTFVDRLASEVDIVHVFSTSRDALERQLVRVRKAMRADAVVWASWPKKASGVATDLTEDVIRRVALPLGLVDVKVCAVDDVWSALKLVIRKELR